MKLTRIQLRRLIKEVLILEVAPHMAGWPAGPDIPIPDTMPMPSMPKSKGKRTMSDPRALNKALAAQADKRKDPSYDKKKLRKDITAEIEASLGGPNVKSTIFNDSDDYKKIENIVYAEPKLPELEKEWKETLTWGETMGKLKNPKGYPGFAWDFAVMITLRRLELEGHGFKIASKNLDEYMIEKLTGKTIKDTLAGYKARSK